MTYAPDIPRRFYCPWTLPIDLPWPVAPWDPEKNCCFNHFFGLPTRKWESDGATAEAVHVELTRQNKRMIDDYFAHYLYSKDKTRGDGTTEILSTRLMSFKYGAVNTIPNHMGAIIPGTSQKLTDEISSRIKALCDVHPQIYEGGLPPNALSPRKFHFADKGRIELTSATPDAIRGYENVGDVIMEEVAHWDILDDMPVYFAAHGVHEKSRCHITHNTTPRSKRGFYYDLVWAPEARSSYFRRVVNWRQVVGLPVMEIEDLYGMGRIGEAEMAAMREELVRRYDDDMDYRLWYDTFEKSGVRVFWEDGTPRQVPTGEKDEKGRDIMRLRTEEEWHAQETLIPVAETVDVPVPLLDINAIIADSQANRLHYDQELDNEFISGANRAIGDIYEADDVQPDDLAAAMSFQHRIEGLEDINRDGGRA